MAEIFQGIFSTVIIVSPCKFYVNNLENKKRDRDNASQTGYSYEGLVFLHSHSLLIFGDDSQTPPEFV